MNSEEEYKIPNLKIGDLIRWREGYHSADKTVMLVIEVGSDGIFLNPDDPAPMLSHNLIRYWHPKYGDGGWSAGSSFELVAKVF